MSMWTPERIRNLIELWNAGRTATQIAPHLGITRSAVIGKVDRLRKKGVNLRSTKPCNAASPRQRVPYKTTKSARVPSLPVPDRGKPRAALPPEQLAVQAAPKLPSGQPKPSTAEQSAPVALEGPLVAQHIGPLSGIPIDELDDSSCRFPLWAHTARRDDPAYGMYCGGIIKLGHEEAPLYCEFHQAKCTATKRWHKRQDQIVEGAVELARARGTA